MKKKGKKKKKKIKKNEPFAHRLRHSCQSSLFHDAQQMSQAWSTLNRHLVHFVSFS